jgi:hypothetical protein
MGYMVTFQHKCTPEGVECQPLADETSGWHRLAGFLFRRKPFDATECTSTTVAMPLLSHHFNLWLSSRASCISPLLLLSVVQILMASPLSATTAMAGIAFEHLERGPECEAETLIEYEHERGSDIGRERYILLQSPRAVAPIFGMRVAE